jgi:UDP-N-acetylglucosamine--N-acetylmuramyl-(pentapeptide) pyrophosphoryl-undecaprenol N-acetylglucosamine transferase
VKADDSRLSELRLVFIGGGSGGHLFPAIAVCEAILQWHDNIRLLFLTSRRHVDTQILRKSGLDQKRLRVVPYASLPWRSGRMGQLLMLPGSIRSFQSAKRELREFQPHVAIGVGAAASVPGVIAASRLKIPVVLMEQNTVPGKATRLLAPRAAVTLTGLPFESTETSGWPGALEITGTPVRSSISELCRRIESSAAIRQRLLILGGSQGSSSVNRLVLEALADERCVPSDWEIIHQTGEAEVKQVAAEYARRGRTASVLSFLPNLPDLLASATVVISRGGAGTLQELACAGLPSILIPFSRAASNHQYANAELLQRAGAARLVNEIDGDAGLNLRRELNALIQQPDTRQSLREGIRCFAKPDAARISAQKILELCWGASFLGTLDKSKLDRLPIPRES